MDYDIFVREYRRCDESSIYPCETVYHRFESDEVMTAEEFSEYYKSIKGTREVVIL